MRQHRRADRHLTGLNGLSEPGSTKAVMEEHPSRDGQCDGPVPKLSGEVRSLLGKRLRAVYAALVREPVPERFLKLLEKLEATERTS